ncbi:competence protein [Oceanobacillus arenosus]|uniref:Competence protein n=1 Tax=Oceanobacillus arenosus TaxID=1229153 RepID=A0A3D8PZ49_9BACI|nr:competence protein ComK [Oceanobacillus arenosus]RDW21436.1 competence protein [Oceanobacillus arenosus]
MQSILSEYTITDRTMALLPAKHHEYDTIVFEQNNKLYVKKTPMQLIKQACLEHYSTYEGRREAVKHHTGFRRKIPLPINPEQCLYAFPTHSTTDYECCWIFYHHVLYIKAFQSDTNPNIKSMNTFKDFQQVPINVSSYILHKQMQRTLTIIGRNYIRVNNLT